MYIYFWLVCADCTNLWGILENEMSWSMGILFLKMDVICPFCSPLYLLNIYQVSWGNKKKKDQSKVFTSVGQFSFFLCLRTGWFQFLQDGYENLIDSLIYIFFGADMNQIRYKFFNFFELTWFSYKAVLTYTITIGFHNWVIKIFVNLNKFK